MRACCNNSAVERERGDSSRFGLSGSARAMSGLLMPPRERACPGLLFYTRTPRYMCACLHRGMTGSGEGRLRFACCVAV